MYQQITSWRRHSIREEYQEQDSPHPKIGVLQPLSSIPNLTTGNRTTADCKIRAVCYKRREHFIAPCAAKDRFQFTDRNACLGVKAACLKETLYINDCLLQMRSERLLPSFIPS